ncbi:MAG: hypothetical protein Q9227_000247 [Pyrenula ochraceoflavens]
MAVPSNVASTVTKVVTTTVSSTTSTSTSRAANQGGILEHGDPSEYDPKNPMILFIIQAGIIIIFCRLLHFPLSKLRQPRVIAEVIGGVLLGPSVMGRIPGFKSSIFPDASMPNLTLVANLGLVLFLFLVGLEVDLRFFVRHWRTALSVGAAGMALPFGLGCGIAYGLYHEFREDSGLKPIAFGTYMLFVGVAMAITAFPVLCRILTELKLLQTPVGVITLSAGVGNDIVGWILLALCVALVNSGSGITALYVLLTAVGYILFLTYAIRPIFLWNLRRTGSLQNGPTQTVVALTLLLTLVSAFFTGVIGIHPIFGGFVIGLICPHEGGFAIKMTEKIEDLVSTIFLPLYFALSGLSTNLGLLDSGIAWGYVVGVIAVAFCGKFVGGTLASRLNGMLWRESVTIGAMMSCKGLVELIVLNIGLQAKILSQRTFTIFVVMALITTFATTPLTMTLYPEWYRKKVDLWRKGRVDWDGNPILTEDNFSERVAVQGRSSPGAISKLFVYLRLDALPGIFEFIALLGDREVESTPLDRRHHLAGVAREPTTDSASKPKETVSLRRWRKPLDIHGLRLVELTERYTSVMQVSELEEFAPFDPVVKAFRTFARFNAIAVSGDVAVVPERSYADTLLSRASDSEADLLLLPWSESGAMAEEFPTTHALIPRASHSQLATGPYTHFVSSVLKHATVTTVGVFVDRGFGQPADHVSLAESHGHHIFVPYFGGPDDHFALRFALRLAQNANVTVTIAFFEIDASDNAGESNDVAKSLAEAQTTPSEAATSKNSKTANLNRITSSNRDHQFVSTRTTPAQLQDDSFVFSNAELNLPSSLSSRVIFQHLPFSVYETIDPAAVVLRHIQEDLGKTSPGAGQLVLLGRGSDVNSMAGSGSHVDETTNALGTLGAEVLTEKGVSLLVVQAGKTAREEDGGRLKKRATGEQ